jgi:phosphoribosylaminoimidazolecarboxamide formyltransferase/IMP cyclohydrolase
MNSAGAWALISVSDKTGIDALARALAGAGFGLLSTGGTASLLREKGLVVTDVSEFTGFPEMMDGRVKTLHPKVHGGLLGRRDLETHLGAMREHGIPPIDFVVVNLYPFEETVRKEGVSPSDVIEQIDIGGPSMLRSAAKNYASVTVICDPSDYGLVEAELKESGGTSLELRRELAQKVFARTASYDAAIASWMGGGESVPFNAMGGARKQELRYGENPHQRAAFYELASASPSSLARARFLGGKELSYNNILDLDAAWRLCSEFTRDQPACAVIKHGNPCGTALGATGLEAYQKALAGDPQSAFGSIVACNFEVDAEAGTAMAGPGNFIEVVIAPSYTEEALAALRRARFGKNLRILETGDLGAGEEPEYRSVSGGFLVQSRDFPDHQLDLKVVTERQPSEEEMAALRFAWVVCKHVRSNAIVLARGTQTVGVGAGQMSRVDSVEISVKKAGERAKGSVLASDAFFPFPDGVLAAAEAGVTALIQPGGSRRDQEVIDAANKQGMAMVFTGRRHFRH